ncbi:MAG: 2-dehydropantoate 2-reductase [Bacteroidales bacterium]
MEGKKMSVLVVGAGAIGGITCGLLKQSGYDVEILCNTADYSELINDQGLRITGYKGDFTVPVKAYSTIDDIKDKKDIILHATKATDMQSAARDAVKVLKDDGHIVSLQNGFCEDALADIAGRPRVIGCVVGWGASMEKRGEFIMTSGGDFIIGYTDRKSDEFLEILAEMFSVIVPARITENINGHLYAKLIINSCITTLGVVCGLYLGKMLSIRKARKIFIEIIREAMLVAGAMNYKVEIFAGKLDFKQFLSGDGLLASARRHLLIRIIGFKYRRLKSSSLQSVMRGKQSEVNFLNGFIVDKAKLCGLEVPVNKALVNMVHEIESGSRAIDVSNFDDPVFDGLL